MKSRLAIITLLALALLASADRTSNHTFDVSIAHKSNGALQRLLMAFHDILGSMLTSTTTTMKPEETSTEAAAAEGEGE